MDLPRQRLLSKQRWLTWRGEPSVRVRLLASLCLLACIARCVCRRCIQPKGVRSTSHCHHAHSIQYVHITATCLVFIVCGSTGRLSNDSLLLLTADSPCCRHCHWLASLTAAPVLAALPHPTLLPTAGATAGSQAQSRLCANSTLAAVCCRALRRASNRSPLHTRALCQKRLSLSKMRKEARPTTSTQPLSWQRGWAYLQQQTRTCLSVRSI